MTGTALAVEHFSLHAGHTSGTDVAPLTDLGALRFCRGASDDRITDLASIKE
jgi:hypothetical protein